MKKNISKLFILVLVLGSNLAIAQNTSDIIIGKRTTIKSILLNSEREIMIYLPNSYGNNEYTKYPVLYLLDGKKFFHPFTGAVAQLSSDASPQIPEMIIIGITSQDRIKDSSPTHSLIGYSGKEENGYELSGGANRFLNFIKKELIPYVDSNYRTNSYRTFVGYSFTGLPILHSLFTSPETFNSYLVIDFSAWWDNEVTLKNAKTFFQEYKGSNKDVFLTTVDRVFNNVYPETYNTGWGFIKEFEQNHPDAISFGYKKYQYKKENHHTMPLISFIDGLKFIFRGHMINYNEMFSDPTLIKPKFIELSDRLGYDVFLNESLVNSFGYQFLYGSPNLDKAIFFFQYNTENYPLSANAWDGLATAYNVKGDKEKAIEYYRKALKLDPENDAIRKRIKELTE